MHGLATLTAQGQMTIPRDMRQRLGLRPKARRLVIMVQGNAAVLISLRVRSLTAFFVVLPAAKPVPRPARKPGEADDAPRCRVAADEE